MSPPKTPKPPALARVINPHPVYLAFGPYPCRVAIEVTPAEAASLARRGFVPVIATPDSPDSPAPIPPTED